MGNKKKMVAVLALIPLFLMVAGGLAVSHWDDEVQVTGSVALGTFNIQMSLEDYWDNEYYLDVGQVQASLVDMDDGDDTDGGVNDALSIQVSNVYPGYEICVEFNVDNVGSIPANLSNLFSTNFVTSFDWDTYKQYFQFNITYMTDDGDVLIMHLDEDGNLIMDYDFETDPLGLTTLDAGESEYFILCFGLEAEPVNAPEDLMGQTLSIELVMEWIQAVP
ncbi:MAG: hypothetical protein F7B19_05810 [Desulfurococcales archaeon]|nr:hypothetical protein [Desulfurococcales archaeon]MCE4626125.1 hypothetical protein [Desulfurococcales archaeon]